MNQKDRLLRDIGIVDFVMVELTLYLDTHPHDATAMEYFQHYRKVKNQLEHEFAEKYYPLNLRTAQCSKDWDWGMAPAPWEGGC